jgi:hypothetical protein
MRVDNGDAFIYICRVISAISYIHACHLPLVMMGTSTGSIVSILKTGYEVHTQQRIVTLN